jgi:hypothetical protein
VHTSSVPLPHLPFFAVLAGLEESSPEWRVTTAGLLALRMFEQWTERARRDEPLEEWEIAAVREAIDAAGDRDVGRNILRGIVDLASRPGARPAAALAGLTAYARSLQFDGRWSLAADVYGTVVEYGEAPDPELALTACYLRSYCLRMTGALDEAAASIEHGRALAARCGDLPSTLQADIADAALALHRGNLPQAEALLDGVIARAEKAPAAAHCQVVLCRALHDRANVAARRRQFEDAAVYGHRALALCSDSADRERILGDVATALGDAGHRAAARDAHLVLVATAQAAETRWTAMVNLVELAALDGREPLFERHRRELAGIALPPMLSAYYHLFVGEGCQRFGRTSSARSALAKAAAVAQEYRINEVLLKAEAALDELERSPAPAPVEVAPEARPTSPALTEVIESVGTMRELAGAGAEG